MSQAMATDTDKYEFMKHTVHGRICDSVILHMFLTLFSDVLTSCYVQVVAKV